MGSIETKSGSTYFSNSLFFSPTSSQIAGFGSYVSSLILIETLYIMFYLAYDWRGRFMSCA